MIVNDLETVNPVGRIDVLAYRGVERLAKHAETVLGMSGIWEAVKPHVNKAIAEQIGPIDVPTEAKILLEILRANYRPEVKE